jgi:hypothetical protein
MDGRGEPSSVSVAPIYKVENKEKAGDAGNPVDVGDGKVDQVLFVYEEGSEYNYTLPIDGIVAYWRLDDDGRDSAGDYDVELIGSSSIGTFNGRDCASFPGQRDDYARYPDASDLAPGMNSFTFSSWIYPTTFGSVDRSSYNRFFGHYNTCGSDWKTNPDKKHCVWLLGGLNRNGRINFGGRGYANTETFDALSANGVAKLNEWQHVVYVLDRDSGEHYIYYNGEYNNGTEIVKDGDTLSELGNLNMTNYFSFPSSWTEFGGYMDDVMIYHRALTPQEIKAIYDVQKS